MSDITDAELELEYQERNKNLKNTINDLVDNAKEKGQKIADTIQENTNQSMLNTPSSNKHYYIDQIYNSSASMSNSNTSSDALNSDQGFSPTLLDKSTMNSIDHDIQAMGSRTAEGFEPVAAKLDENFGINALVE